MSQSLGRGEGRGRGGTVANGLLKLDLKHLFLGWPETERLEYLLREVVTVFHRQPWEVLDQRRDLYWAK